MISVVSPHWNLQLMRTFYNVVRLFCLSHCIVLSHGSPKPGAQCSVKSILLRAIGTAYHSFMMRLVTLLSDCYQHYYS